MDTAAHAPKRLVVVGASAGGLEAVMDLVADLPAGFAAAVLVVIHTGPSGPSFLAEILNRASVLPVSEAVDGEALRSGHIYVATPDRHLLVQDGAIAVKRGPRENRFRPSVDALFRSAAYTHGAEVIGVILSGMLDDGTSGLWTVKRLGGVSVVQTPSDALYDAMPRSALDHVEVDYVLPVAGIGALLARLVQEPPASLSPPLEQSEQRRLEVEVKTAAEHDAFELGWMHLGALSPLTCPECRGVLLQVQEGRRTRYRCHTGHAYTATSLRDSLDESVESALYQALRSLEEAAMLFGHLEQQEHALGNGAAAQHFHGRAQQAWQIARQIQAISARTLVPQLDQPAMQERREDS
ncbi:chemotaxis protein CheB [Deinococcus sp.]|uniref:chemotaxis protein CheB n=1 Tax=Deinococcus sp. TaxID=47478 RepID=UPI003CC622C6